MDIHVLRPDMIKLDKRYITYTLIPRELGVQYMSEGIGVHIHIVIVIERQKAKTLCDREL